MALVKRKQPETRAIPDSRIEIEIPLQGHFRKFIPITKIDEAKREVGGIVTAEKPDKADEVCDYESTVPYYKAWSDALAKASGGKNLGNLREMHQLSVAGVGKQLEFQDDLKQIFMMFKVVDDDAWIKCQEGAYTGFSQGGEYVKTWKGTDGLLHYTANPIEVSLVDNPCLPEGSFQFVRADGRVEMRKFVASSSALIKAKKKIQAVVGKLKGEDTTTVQSIIFSPKSEWTEDECKTWLKDHDFKAPAVDETESSFRFRQVDPDKFEENAMDNGATFATIPFKGGKKKAMAITDSKKSEKQLLTIIRKACDAVIEAKAEEMGLTKDMYDVERFAEILQGLAYLRMSAGWERENEGDDSDLPEKLQEDLEALAETFLAAAQEEVGELITSANKAASTGGRMPQSQAVQKAASAADHLKKMHEAHKAFHAKIHKLHKDREAEMDDHMEKLHKILGTGEVASPESGNEPESVDPATQGASGSMKTMFDQMMQKLTALPGSIEKQIGEAIDKNNQLLLEGLLGEDKTAEALKTAGQNRKAAASAGGIGDRSDVDSSGAPKTHLALKAEDSSVAGLQAKSGSEAPKADVKKAVQGNVDEVLKLMSGVKSSSPSEFAREGLVKLQPK